MRDETSDAEATAAPTRPRAKVVKVRILVCVEIKRGLVVNALELSGRGVPSSEGMQLREQVVTTQTLEGDEL